MPEAPPQRSRRGAEAALEELRDAAQAQTHGTICLAGPSGPARSRLLRALAEHLSPRFRSVQIGQPDPSPAGLWTLVAQALGFTPGYDARRRVIHHLADLVQREMGLLLLVDAADSLPADTLASLVSNARAEVGLHVVLAAASERALAGPLPEDVTLVRWDGEPLAEPEAVPSAPRAAAPPEPDADGETEDAPLIPVAAPRRAARPRRRSGIGRAAWILAGLELSAGIGLLLARSLPGSRLAAPSPTESGVPAPEPVAPPPREVAPPPRETAAPPQAEAPPPADVSPPPSEPAEPAANAAADAAASPADMPPPAPNAADPAAEPVAGRAPEPEPAQAAPPAEAEPMAEPEPARAEPVAVPAPVPAPEPTPVVRPGAAPRATERKPPEPAAPLSRGVLRIESESPVRIEIDGRPYGRTPVVGVRLPRGVHRVVARYPDGATALKTVTLGDHDVSIFYR